MQALRLARPRVALRSISGTRSIAATANASQTAAASASTSSQPAIPLSNVEAQWERLSSDEQYQVHRQLEEIQKKDWRSLSIDEKKAGMSFAFPQSRFLSLGGNALLYLLHIAFLCTVTLFVDPTLLCFRPLDC